MDPLGYGNDATLGRLGSFDGRTDPIHGVGGETKASIRFVLFGSTDECLQEYGKCANRM